MITENSKPHNTKRNRDSIWNQRKHELSPDMPTEVIAAILKDWAVNMRKTNGKEYKEYSIKTIWNVTAKML